MNQDLNNGASDAKEFDAADIDEIQAVVQSMRAEIGKVIVGQNEVIDQLMIALLCRGHCLLIGVPGLAKTLLVSTIAQMLELTFRRIQFTPDLMPADITGTDVLQEDPSTGRHTFEFMQGPLFANVVLADEINRTPPKTQSALLEAMQEHHVTSGSTTYPLPEPFFVLATQNPIEQEGTYPLPEAQLDRFMFNVLVDYPTADEELSILKQTTDGSTAKPKTTIAAEKLIGMQQLISKIPVADHVYVYARDLVRASRPDDELASDFIREHVTWGAGPRAGQHLIWGAKACAVLAGRIHVTSEDVKKIAAPILRHRLVTTFQADRDNVKADDIVDQLLRDITVALKAEAQAMLNK